MEVIEINVIASLNIFNDKDVHLVKCHISDNSPKQFEDNFGNLWYVEELSNFNHIN